MQVIFVLFFVTGATYGIPAKNQSVVRFSLLEESLSDDYVADFPFYVDGLVRGDPGGFVLTPTYAQVADTFQKIPLRSDDVWVITFPKCGTTWTQEMVWMITHNVDTKNARKQLFSRSPFLESSVLVQDKSEFDADELAASLRDLERLPSPRVIKSHLPFDLLPAALVNTSKVVYVARNPKDVIVSFFHHYRFFRWFNLNSSVETFANYFMNDEVYYSPFFPHLLEGWARKDHPNVLFLFYEDMKANLRTEIKKVCDFLGKTLSARQMQLLLKHLHFDNFSKNKAVNLEALKEANDTNFIRKGQIGDWKNHFSPEFNNRLDQWIASNMNGSDLLFTMEHPTNNQ